MSSSFQNLVNFKNINSLGKSVQANPNCINPIGIKSLNFDALSILTVSNYKNLGFFSWGKLFLNKKMHFTSLHISTLGKNQ